MASSCTSHWRAGCESSCRRRQQRLWAFRQSSWISVSIRHLCRQSLVSLCCRNIASITTVRPHSPYRMGSHRDVCRRHITARGRRLYAALILHVACYALLATVRRRPWRFDHRGVWSPVSAIFCLDGRLARFISKQMMLRR